MDDLTAFVDGGDWPLLRFARIAETSVSVNGPTMGRAGTAFVTPGAVVDRAYTLGCFPRGVPLRSPVSSSCPQSLVRNRP